MTRAAIWEPRFEIRTGSRTPVARREAILAEPVFGSTFTDHVATACYTEADGWHDFAVQPFGDLTLSPASSVLHYGQSIFEGLKAYRQPDGSITLFRPEQNAARLRSSAERIAMPTLPEDVFLAALRSLLTVEHSWVPAGEGRTLYLRPLMFATQPRLFVTGSSEFRFLVLASPAGEYFRGGMRALTVWAEQQYVRASPGGTGAAKFAGNYGAALIAQRRAAEAGCDQVVWLDATEHRFVEELGAMNVFLVVDEDGQDTLCTPPAGDTVLAGVTRDSLLTLARDQGLAVRVGPISLAEWRAGAADGTVREAFACGTAVGVAPIGQVRSSDGGFVIGDGAPGPLTIALRQQLLDLQFGRTADPYGWRAPAVVA